LNKKVLAISNQRNLLGGGEHSFLDLLTRLPHSWQTIVSVPGAGEVKSKLCGTGVSTRTIPLSPIRPWSAKNMFCTLTAYKKLCEEFKPDLIYANGSRAAFYAGIIGSLLKIPVVWHCRVADFDSLFDLVLCKMCQKIITNSHATAKRFKSKYQKKIRVIYNGIDIDWLNCNSHPKPQLIETEWKIIVTVARVSKLKRHDVVLSAFEIVAKIDPNVHLICVGEKDSQDPEWYNTMLQKTARSRFSERIHWVGKVEDVRPWYHSAWLSVLVSENEAFGRVIVESMACGIPVVATRSGGIPEIVRSGIDGYLVECGCVADTAQAMIKLIRDDNLRSKIAKSGRNRAGHFSLDSHIEKMVEVFNSTIMTHSKEKNIADYPAK
jgi:glycosyltransferase involved in cell wall biosynthesis